METISILQVAPWGFGIVGFLIALIVVLAVIAIVYIAVRAFGIPIPGWLWQMVGVVIIAFVAIVCIRLLLSM